MGYMFSSIADNIKIRAKHIIVMADMLAILCALFLALLLRFDNMSASAIYATYLAPHIYSLPVVVVLYIFLLSKHRLYRYAWRFLSIEVVWSIFCANTLGLACMIITQQLIDDSTMPMSVLIIFWMLCFIFISSFRIMLRVINRYTHASGRSAKAVNDVLPKRAIIIGAGNQGARVLHAINDDPTLRYNIIGFLDDADERRGIYVGNIPVLGHIKLLKNYVRNKKIDEVIVALSESDYEEIRPLVLACRKNGIPVKIVPSFSDTLSSKHPIRFEDFSVEDLLRRPAQSTNIESFGNYLTGRRILVTGAGGSIGSELCRQIIALKPEKLFLLGHGENSIFQILQELKRDYPQLADQIAPIIACVTNKRRIDQIFNSARPHIVFHAAAHKHVPLMEQNIIEAANNNVIGTYNIAEACGKFKVMKMVLVSTDKAAKPHSIMGATKWLCESVMLSGARRWESTAFIAVRFGNVLGSRGSVIPVFKEQIKNGGPVTVTHPEMTRFFMTIPEASRLVVQAGAVGDSGELYLLDMGKPVRILDLAEDMIRLSGLEPNVDIRVEFSGIRPGEKLHEQLTSEKEQIEKTEWEGLSIVHRPETQSPARMPELISQMLNVIEGGDDSEMLALFREVIAGYLPDCEHSITTSSARPTQV